MLAPLDLSNSCKKIKHSQHGFTAPLASSPTILHTALASSTLLSSSTIYLLPRPSICHPSLLHATVLLDSSNFGCERDISRDHLFPLPTPLLPPQSCPLPLHLVNDVRCISQRQHFIVQADWEASTEEWRHRRWGGTIAWRHRQWGGSSVCV